MSRNRLGPVVATLAVAAVLAAGASTAGARGGDTVTLNVLMYTTAQPAWQILNANFERVYPNIKINATFLPSTDLFNVLPTQLQAGNAPDAFTIQPAKLGVTGVWVLAPAGRLLNLTGRPWKKRIYPPMRHQVTYKNKVYAWPIFVQPHDPVYNIDLLNQLHLKIPTSFSQLLAQCKTIRDAGKVPFEQSMNTVAGGIILSRQFASNFVYAQDPNWDTKRYQHKVTFASSPLWKRMLQAIVDMKNANCFNEGLQGVSRPQQYAAFAQGQAVYSLITSGEIANMTAINPNLKYAMFNLPPDNPKKQLVQGYAGIVLAGNADTKHPKEVKEWIDFYARAKQSTLAAKIGAAIAPFDAMKGVTPDFLKPMAKLLKANKVDGPHDGLWPCPNTWQDSIAIGINGLFTGQTTVESILAKADQLWDQGQKGC
jgi:raffinose/stachyose/melibiose transport system substrate-binding protein